MDISRRSVATGIASSVMIAGSHTAFGSQTNSAVSMGVIGTGGRGRYVGGIFAKDPKARLTAICDIFSDRIDLAKTQMPTADKARVYKDYKELLDQKDIDAVLITTPVYLHPEHFEAAVKAGKHIYCEKPAGASVAGVKRLLRAAELADPNKNIGFGFQQRYGPEYLAAERILRSGQLGELLMMQSHWIVGGASVLSTRPSVPPQTEEQKIRQWYAWRETSGDFIVEQDCHGVDVLNWFAQAHPLKARGTGGRRKRTFGDNRDHYNITYEYPGGVVGWLTAMQLAQKYGEVNEQFFGTEGVIETSRSHYKWYRGGKEPVYEKSKRDITIDAVDVFLTRVAEGKPQSQAFSACESTFTSLLGRLAVDLGREVSWEEMLASA